MSFRFHPDAETELFEAIQYYENVELGLGQDFAVETYLAIQRAALNPLAWAVIGGEVRRTLLRRFPYGILYAQEEGEILIVAVMHLHREPSYWQKRV